MIDRLMGRIFYMGWFQRIYRRLVELRYGEIKKPVILRNNRRFLFEFQPGEDVVHHIYEGSFVDDEGVLAYAERVLRKGRIAFDVGSCMGVVAFSAARKVLPGGKVFAFEAESVNHRYLCRNIELNKFEGLVVPVDAAVGAVDGTVTLNVFSRECHGWNSLGWEGMGDVRPVAKQKVTGVTLDAFCAAHDIATIDFIKVDVEGAEPEVFKGAARLLSTHAIRRMVFEVSREPLKGMGYAIRDVIRPLSDAGYVLRHLNADGTLAHVAEKIDQVTFANYVALAPGVDE